MAFARDVLWLAAEKNEIKKRCGRNYKSRVKGGCFIVLGLGRKKPADKVLVLRYEGRETWESGDY